MAAQQNKQESSSRGSSQQEQQGQQTALTQRSSVPSGLSLWEPMDMFNINPFSMMRRLNDEISRVFGQTGLTNASARGDDFVSAIWAPAIEVAYRDGNFEVSAELPGLKEDEVRVEVTNDALIIQGERRIERQEGDGGIRRTERRYGQFYRLIALPDGADAENARAEFRDGILRVTIPVSEAQSRTRQIPIQGADGSQRSQSQRQVAGQTEDSGRKKAA